MMVDVHGQGFQHAAFAVGAGGGSGRAVALTLPATRSIHHCPLQFWGIKARCMDLVLFCRHGSFYNL
jgi:hypothetical protein